MAAAQNVAAYETTADIFHVAAAYAYHVAQNQPFLDGNKRPGLAAATESVLAQALIDVAERRWPEPRLALADVLRRLSSGA